MLIIIVYIILLAFGFKSTWNFVVNTVLAGSSEIVGAIVLFIIMILIVGPIIGIINLVKLAITKFGKSKIDKNL